MFMKPRQAGRLAAVAMSLAALTALSGCGGGSAGPTPLPETLAVTAPPAGDIASGVAFDNSAGAMGGFKYTWDFGDGSKSVDAAPSHRYANAGEYQVTLTVTNEAGGSKQATRTVLINNQTAVRGLECSGADSGGWCWQAPLVSAIDARATTFVDANTGWRVGALGMIQRTTDAGKTWSRQRSGVTAELNQVAFFDARIGWASGPQGTLLRTTDAGESWTAVTSPAAVPANASIKEVPSAQSVLIAEGAGRYHWSDDAGRTWRSADMQFSSRLANGVYLHRDTYRLNRYAAFGTAPTTLLDVRATGAFIVDAAATDANVIVLLTRETNFFAPLNPKVWRSEDGGATWASWTPTGSAAWVQGVKLLALDSAASTLLVSDNDGLYRSEDGGRNWTRTLATQLLIPPQLQVTGAHVLFSPLSYNAMDSSTMISSDQGKTWRSVPIPARVRPDVTGDRAVSAVGGALVMTDSAQGIFVSGDFGITWSQAVPGWLPYPAAQRKAVFRDARYGVMFNGLGDTQVTTDGGRTWAARSTGPAPQALQFIDATRAVMAARDGRFYRSTDGGEHWSETASAQRIGAFRFFGARNGWAVEFNGPWRIFIESAFLLTRDGGDSWATVTAPGGYVTEGGVLVYLGASDAHIADSGRITVVGSGPGGHITQSDDNGITWTRRSTGLPPLDSNLSRVYSRDDQVFWVLNGSNIVLRSVDGGVSWTKVEFPANWHPIRVHFADAKNGWMVGGEGLIIATRDGGATWTEQASGTRAVLTEVQFVDSRTGWINVDQTELLATGTGGY
jgi:photosystem II stability/assembly factor-like uncharacterized protein